MEQQARFSTEFKLAGNATSKTHGVASSPLGDVVACCVTTHPSDMMQYAISNEMTLSVLFSEETPAPSELFPAYMTKLWPHLRGKTQRC